MVSCREVEPGFPETKTRSPAAAPLPVQRRWAAGFAGCPFSYARMMQMSTSWRGKVKLSGSPP
jgi:hypothetical protein